MTGAAHYEAAEKRMLASDWQWQQAAEQGDIGWANGAMHEVAMAAVHANLALTAAIWCTRTVDGQHAAEWNRVTGKPPAEEATQ